MKEKSLQLEKYLKRDTNWIRRRSCLPDDFVYISHARYFTSSGGGYSGLANSVDKVIQSKPKDMHGGAGQDADDNGGKVPDENPQGGSEHRSYRVSSSGANE